MINDYIYYSENSKGTTYCNCDRDDVLEWYERNNGVKIWTQTKDLFPAINIIVDAPNVDINNIRKGDIVNKTSVALRKAVEKYDKENTKQIALKLNKNTDKEILKKLQSVKNMQGYIKELILKDLERNN